MAFPEIFGRTSSRVGIRPNPVLSRPGMRPEVFSFRTSVKVALILLALTTISLTPYKLFGQHPTPASPPRITAPRAAPSPHPPAAGPAHPTPQPRPPGQQHLNEWMQRNQGLTAQEQVNRLHQEPGFNRLTPQQQDKVTDRLKQLRQMPPEQRQRYLERVENMERLSPPQQAQVRGSARTLGQLPPDRQQVVKEAIRNLRNVPPGLRQTELNSPGYVHQLTPQERGIAQSLLSVESYHPPPPPPR